MTWSMQQLGVDYGAIDGNKNIDFVKAKEAGATFAYRKRSQNMTPDAGCAADVDAARKAGLVVGQYFFPNLGKLAESPKRQIAACKAAPGDIVPKVDLPLAIDVESIVRFLATGATKAGLVEGLRQFVFEVQDQMGHKPAIYSSFNQWYDLGLPLAAWLRDCPLWIKTAYRLAAKRPVDQVAPGKPHVGNDAMNDKYNYLRIPDPWIESGAFMQQFQGDAAGFPGIGQVDVDRLNTLELGDSDPLVKWVQRKCATLALPEVGPLPITGIFDQATEAAVKAHQVQGSLLDTGIVDVHTITLLAWS